MLSSLFARDIQAGVKQGRNMVAHAESNEQRG